ncbi:MAG: SufD family Fe-S cluster assembly protein [Kiritimatiellae bacterium]|nr:SufD family Fe-S cluster assembly protein [Kiritimatiellia bacterium]
MAQMLSEIQKALLKELTGVADFAKGAFNIRANGASAGRQSTETIRVEPKKDGTGLDIHIAPGTRDDHVRIPVVMTESGLKEEVFNDFHVGEGAEVTIVAGCGIHNCGCDDSQHDGIHRFFIGRGARVKYVEKHVGQGDGTGRRILNPVTEVHQEEDSVLEMEMSQLRGVDATERTTTAELKAGARLAVRERLLTGGAERAVSRYEVRLDGAGAVADIISRGVARDDSLQRLDLKIVGNAPCRGHTECDSIIMDRGHIVAVPTLEAANVDAELVHEAAIGKIAGDQLDKLMSLGLTPAEAEARIIEGFLS